MDEIRTSYALPALEGVYGSNIERLLCRLKYCVIGGLIYIIICTVCTYNIQVCNVLHQFMQTTWMYVCTYICTSIVVAAVSHGFMTAPGHGCSV